MTSKHEAAIQLLIEKRDYWRSRIALHEEKVTALKNDIIALRDERSRVGEKLVELDQSIATLKAAS